MKYKRMPTVSKLYKSFRNRLRHYELIDSLHLIWALSRNLTFNYPLPDDIEMPTHYNPNESVNHRRLMGLPEFEIEFFLKEIIINCSNIKGDKSLKTHKNLGPLVNYRRHTLEEGSAKNYLSDNIFIEFNRMVHNQFLWQQDYHTSTIMRYYKIYSHVNFIQIFNDTFGMSPTELLKIGFGFFYLTGKYFRINGYSSSKVIGLSDELLENFLSRFSTSIKNLKKELQEKQELNANLFYSYNPLLAKPLIQYEDSIICPIPLLVYWQVTNGLYYSLINKKGFENAYGKAFEDYIGEVIHKANVNNAISALPEEVYGKEEKRTSDWILYDNESIMFLECKTKRLTLVSKTQLDIDIEKGLRSDLNYMAKFIVQIYKTFSDYRNGLFTSLPYDETKKIYPIIVTLEDWFLPINPELMEILNSKVIEKLIEINLDKNLITKCPYYIFSADKFENHVQIIQEKGIEIFLRMYNNNELQHLNYRNLWEGEYQETFS